jgi:hypothetical protein
VSGLVRASAATTLILGLALIGWSLWRGTAFPLALVITLVTTGVVLVVLGVGLARRARAAWSFTLAIIGVLTTSGLLAMPAIVRSGFPPILAGLVLAALVGLGATLIMGRDAF